MHLTRFWSGTCHRGFKNIPVPYTKIDNKISACKGNMKESWKTINELLNKRSKSSNIDCLKESSSETVHRKDIPGAINSYFCSVGKDLADKISPVANPLLSGEFEMNKTKAKVYRRDTRDS